MTEIKDPALDSVLMATVATGGAPNVIQWIFSRPLYYYQPTAST